MNYTTLVQAIAQQGIASNSNMKLRSPTLEKRILNMMEASTTPTKRETWAHQVSVDKHARFAVLTPSGKIKYIRAVVLVNNPDSDNITAVGCSGDGITVGNLVQFNPAMLTELTLSIATSDDTAALDLEAIDVSPTDFKDHSETNVALTIERLGVSEAVNMVVTPVMWPLPPTYAAPHRFDVKKDHEAAAQSESKNGEWKDTYTMC